MTEPSSAGPVAGLGPASLQSAVVLVNAHQPGGDPLKALDALVWDFASGALRQGQYGPSWSLGEIAAKLTCIEADPAPLQGLFLPNRGFVLRHAELVTKTSQDDALRARTVSVVQLVEAGFFECLGHRFNREQIVRALRAATIFEPDCRAVLAGLVAGSWSDDDWRPIFDRTRLSEAEKTCFSALHYVDQTADDLIADFDTMMARTPIRPSHLLAPAALLNQRSKAGVSLSEHAADAGVRAHRFDFDIDAYLFAPTKATDFALSSAHLLADLARVGALEGVPQPSAEERLIAPEDISTIFNGLERSADVIARPLSEQMERYCSALEKDGRNASGFRKFFAQVSERVSDEAYAEVQARFLNAREIEGTLAMVASLFSVDGALAGAIVSPEFKYLDFPLWATSKFRLAKGWGLRDSEPLSILDIGAGPGHLGLVLDLFGHDYLGIDCALYDVKSPSPAQHVYDELCRLFGVKRVEFDVGVDAMPRLDRRFDWVVCTMGTFSTLWEQGNPVGTPWTFEHWRQYLGLLQSTYLNPTHRGVFQINRQYLTDELAAALEETGAEVDRKTSWFSFTEQTRF